MSPHIVTGADTGYTLDSSNNNSLIFSQHFYKIFSDNIFPSFKSLIHWSIFIVYKRGFLILTFCLICLINMDQNRRKAIQDKC